MDFVNNKIKNYNWSGNEIITIPINQLKKMFSSLNNNNANIWINSFYGRVKNKKFLFIY